MQIRDLQKDSLHHAYLVSGDAADLEQLQQSLALLFDIDFASCPDVFVREFGTMLVGDAREVVDFASKSALVAGGCKIICISASSINLNAQNALLKTLEEPTKDTYIFIITPSIGTLLPTILSRCMQMEFATSPSVSLTTSEEVEAFVKAKVPERLKVVERLVKKNKDKKIDKARILALLSGLEVYLHTNKPASVQSDALDKWKMSVRAVLSAREYVNDKGAMSKMLMESVALVI